MSKLIKNEIRKDLKVCEEKLASRILEENWSTRKLRREIYKSKSLLPTLKAAGAEVHNRSGIIDLATTMKTHSAQSSLSVPTVSKSLTLVFVRELEPPILESAVFGSDQKLETK